ncbi:hypothetical protein AKJ48_02995 [candidate division MSBL1 archaeon SCGC-AAA261O19]|uniref:UDP-glucose 6-dehydrogenase n=1 Tax=candidate division MSBL1 archaeon SCGC-AAA261O19 TaxID=1698277 RepID=A0A133VD38_9EURY|nr:hypothetical protein AKJ48_02995 [candidate division MSBL1 archaeon SCGC-AAA261O19]
MSKVEIGVIGLGKLGLPLALLFSKRFKVSGVDISEQRIDQIKNRQDFYEPQVNEYLEDYGDNLRTSTDYKILEDCDVVFIIVPTPSLPSGKFDLQYVESALRQMHKVNPECLAVISSTINIGDMEKLKQIHKRLCYNPEFIKQGSIINDFENPKFVLIGAYEEGDGEQVAEIWSKMNDRPIQIVSPAEAEITKLSLNVSFTLGITFANMIGELCEKFDADSDKVLNIIYKDRRNYKAGLGFMGPCFPRDVTCFETICTEKSIESGYRFANLINDLNSYTVGRWLRKIKSHNKEKIGVLGVAYKPGVPYIYESQPIKIIQQLQTEDHEIYVYDPLAQENAKRVLGSSVHFCSSIGECLDEAEVIFIGTPDYADVDTNKHVVNPWSREIWSTDS